MVTGEKIKSLINSIMPEAAAKWIINKKNMIDWAARGYSEHSPQFIKELVFLRYGIPGAPWIETGTYQGVTTNYLAKRFPHVTSVEPSEKLYERAREKFKGRNIEIINDVSENAFPKILPKLSGDINFWLDGHFSAGITFKGKSDCPVEQELESIKDNLANFDKVLILIDDVRCFLPEREDYPDYPSLDYLVQWAGENGFSWNIEHDIFIMLRS